MGCQHSPPIVQPCVKTVWPIETIDGLDEVVMYPKGTQGTVGELSEDGVKTIQINMQRLIKAYTINVRTLREINK